MSASTRIHSRKVSSLSYASHSSGLCGEGIKWDWDWSICGRPLRFEVQPTDFPIAEHESGKGGNMTHECTCADTCLTVYSKDMPDRLPILLIMRQVSQQIASGILLILRAALVATVWLAALPWVTIKTWRLYFALGNSAYATLSFSSWCLAHSSAVRGGSALYKDRRTRIHTVDLSPIPQLRMSLLPYPKRSSSSQHHYSHIHSTRQFPLTYLLVKLSPRSLC